MNKLVLLSSMVMIGTGIVRGGESLRSEETLESSRYTVSTTLPRDVLLWGSKEWTVRETCVV
ncbi:MAG: hypothetical protein LBR78_02705 [Holosporales bacterium]|nr:hypothetical protein [Holosporales bacterium]